MTISADDTLPNFTDKVVTFYCVNEPPECATALIAPTFARLGGRLFVLGKVAPNQPGHWDDGLESAVAWDQINNFVVFESLDDFRFRLSSYYAQTNSNDSQE